MTETIRSTEQQRLVRKVFEQAQRPLSASEAHALARNQRPRIGIATVYRAIRRMLEAQLLNAVSIAGETTYYEISHAPHHHYFHCEICRRVYVVDGCPGAMSSLTPPGFVLKRHDLVLHGECRECCAGAC